MRHKIGELVVIVSLLAAVALAIEHNTHLLAGPGAGFALLHLLTCVDP